MKNSFLCLALLALLTAGCAQKSQTPEKIATPPAAAPAALPSLSSDNGASAPPPPMAAPTAAPSTAAPTAPVASQGEEVDVERLSIVAGAYYGELKKKPASIRDLVAARFLPTEPVPPQGKAFVIDQETLKVKLVNK